MSRVILADQRFFVGELDLGSRDVRDMADMTEIAQAFPKT